MSQIPVSPEERRTFRTALRYVVAGLVILAVIGSAIGYAVAGMPGVWGAVVGSAVAAFFCTTTVVAMLVTVGKSPTQMAAIVGGTWLLKMVVVVGIFAVISRLEFYDPVVLFVVLAIGLVGSAVLDMRAVQKSRIPWVVTQSDSVIRD
jgi:hypothetical protein